VAIFLLLDVLADIVRMDDGLLIARRFPTNLHHALGR